LAFVSGWYQRGDDCQFRRRGPQPWELLAFIIPGAMLGGDVANHFAYRLGLKRLKIFTALWVTLSSLDML